MRRVAVVAALAALLPGCGAAANPSAERLPAFALTNQSGQTLRHEDLEGRATVISFIFTSCVETCPLITGQLVRVQAEARSEGLGPRVRFVSMTVDPVTDTPEALTRYATGYGVDLASWDFVTGPPAEIARLTTALGVVTRPTGDRLGHTNLVLFVDATGRIVERYQGVDLAPELVVPKIRRLLR